MLHTEGHVLIVIFTISFQQRRLLDQKWTVPKGEILKVYRLKGNNACYQRDAQPINYSLKIKWVIKNIRQKAAQCMTTRKHSKSPIGSGKHGPGQMIFIPVFLLKCVACPCCALFFFCQPGIHKVQRIANTVPLSVQYCTMKETQLMPHLLPRLKRMSLFLFVSL